MGGELEQEGAEKDIIDYIRIMSFDHQSSRDLIAILGKCGLLVSASDAAMLSASGEQQSGRPSSASEDRLTPSSNVAMKNRFRAPMYEYAYSLSKDLCTYIYVFGMYVCMYVCISR